MQFLPRTWIYILTCNLTRKVNPGKWHSTDFRIWRTRLWQPTCGWSSTGETTSWPGSPRSMAGSRVYTCQLTTSGDQTLSSTTSECHVINIQYISLTSTSKAAQYKTLNIPKMRAMIGSSWVCHMRPWTNRVSQSTLPMLFLHQKILHTFIRMLSHIPSGGSVTRLELFPECFWLFQLSLDMMTMLIS